MDRTNDRQLINRLQARDDTAVQELAERYSSRIYQLALRHMKNREDAEEVTQDAFVRAYLHLDQYDARRPFYPWLASIAVRLSQNWLRRHSRTMKREGVPLDIVPEPATTGAGEESLMADERGREIWKAVAALPSGERTAVILYYRDEMNVRDIAAALGVTSGTIKTLLFRARRRLRGSLMSSLLWETPQ